MPPDAPPGRCATRGHLAPLTLARRTTAGPRIYSSDDDVTRLYRNLRAEEHRPFADNVNQATPDQISALPVARPIVKDA